MLETTACSFYVRLSLSSLAGCEYYSSGHSTEGCCLGHRYSHSCPILTARAFRKGNRELTDPMSLPETQPALASSFQRVS